MNSANQTSQGLTQELYALANPAQAEVSARFFKTEKGQYGAGDVFLGIGMPDQRAVAQKYQNLSLLRLESLLGSKEHEIRMTAVLILVFQYQEASKTGNKNLQKELFDFYLVHATRVNNWDMVDASAHHILGDFLLTHLPKAESLALLKKLTYSPDLWERRIAMVATWAFIRAGDASLTLALVTLSYKRGEKEDLMHKANGWMLREVGKHCGREILSQFLEGHAPLLPRTTLRYALEHYEPRERQYYMTLTW
jgi:3-methyladenine DNA glycosylase AlkD